MSALPTQTVVPLYAGFWRRVAAQVIDGLILFIPNFVLALFMPTPTFAIIVQIVIATVYFGFLHSSESQATFGKRAFGIKVTDLAGERISLGRAIGRYFATILSALILGIGFLMAAFTGRRQALHDMVASTLVVNRNASPEAVQAGGQTMPATAGVWIVAIIVFLLPFFGDMLAAIAIPAYQDYTKRSQVMAALAEGEALQREVEESHGQKRQWRTGAVPLTTPYAQGATIDQRGEIRVALADNVVPGGTIVLTPTEDGSRVRWRCTGERLHNRYLPPKCRT